MKSDVEVRTKVAVVGAGPVGTMTANLLGCYGIDTVLVDRTAEIIDYPRAIGVDDEALRTFQAAGLVAPILADTIQNVPLKFFDARGRCFADVRPTTREYGWYRRNVFVQPLAERVLRQGLDRFPHVRTMLGQEVVGLTQDDDSATLELRAADGARSQVRADYVVAADGGRSTLRELLGVRLEGDTHARRWVVIDCANDPLDAPFTGLHCDPRRPYVCAHMPHDHRRWEFMLFPGEDADEMLAPEKLLELLGHHVDQPEKLEVVRARVYTHHSRLASRFVVGRVLLAGDAAHLMPPWAGQGMNTGFRDASNLAWKLAACLREQAGPGLLATYEKERRTHARSMIDLSTRLGRILSPTRVSTAYVRDAALRAATIAPAVRSWVVEMRFKPLPRYEDGIVVPGPRSRREPPGVGRMFIQPDVELDGRCLKLDEALGPGFAVLGFECDPVGDLDEQTLGWLDGMGASVVRVVESRAGDRHLRAARRWPATVVVEDVEGLLRPWFQARTGNVVVLRPDRYVAALTTPRGLGDALATLRERLGATR
jgi:3-(3-hydroxy-phenyl)propionate hydroxylase